MSLFFLPLELSDFEESKSVTQVILRGVPCGSQLFWAQNCLRLQGTPFKLPWSWICSPENPFLPCRISNRDMNSFCRVLGLPPL